MHKRTYTCLQIRRSLRMHMHKKRTPRGRPVLAGSNSCGEVTDFFRLCLAGLEAPAARIISALMAPVPPPAPAECVREVAGAPVAVMREKLSRQI